MTLFSLFLSLRPASPRLSPLNSLACSLAHTLSLSPPTPTLRFFLSPSLRPFLLLLQASPRLSADSSPSILFLLSVPSFSLRLFLSSFLTSTFHSFCVRLSPFLSFSFLPREPCGGAAPGSVGFLFSSRKRNQVSGTREGRSRLTGETLICVLALITLRLAPAVS